MMKTISKMTGIALLLFVIAGGNGCILHDVLTDLVAKHEAFAQYEQNETSASWTKPYILADYGKELRQGLADIGYSPEEGDTIRSAALVAAHYGTVKFSQDHDWRIGGVITVTGPSGTATLINYSNESVQGLLGVKKVASLNAAGVAIINSALQDLIANLNGDPMNDPVLTLTVENGTVAAVPGGGPPAPTDPLIFTWGAWITLEMVITTTVDGVPDPWDNS